EVAVACDGVGSRVHVPLRQGESTLTACRTHRPRAVSGVAWAETPFPGRESVASRDAARRMRSSVRSGRSHETPGVGQRNKKRTPARAGVRVTPIGSPIAYWRATR